MSAAFDDPDRLAILLRRRRFALLAVGGLGLLEGGCRGERPHATEAPELPEVAVVDTSSDADPVVDTSSDADPAVWLEVEPHVDPFEEAHRHDREQQAAALAAAAEQAHARGDHAQAVVLYIEAIDLVPESAEVSYALALEAFEIGDCDISYAALRHFLKLYEGADSAPKNEASRLIEEMEASKCVSERVRTGQP